MSTEAPAARPDNEPFWTGLLSMLRALILGRRLPPDQLRMFLLFAEPVPYLSAEQIASAIGRNCGHDIEPELPEGWAQGVSINDPESGDYYDADAQIVGETLMNLLRKEHPEWEDHWRVSTCDQGWDFLSYRVLDDHGRVHPIACWMEGKLNLLRDGGIKNDEAARRTVICRFIHNTLEWLWDSVGNEDEVAELPGKYQEAATALHAFFSSKSGQFEQVFAMLDRCAEHIYDGGEWEIDEWVDYWVYAPLLWQALNDLGYIEATAHTQTKSLFAA